MKLYNVCSEDGVYLDFCYPGKALFCSLAEIAHSLCRNLETNLVAHSLWGWPSCHHLLFSISLFVCLFFYLKATSKNQHLFGG